MDRVRLGFIAAALYNSSIIIFSKGLGPDLGAVDPLFAPSGCIVILLWGAAYFALSRRYHVAPAVTLVFFVEKAFYAVHWLVWVAAYGSKLPAMIEADPLTGSFFAIYGLGDIAFMIFFGLVGWRWRRNLRGADNEAHSLSR